MKTIFKGELITGDFNENTMTFRIEKEMILTAGEYMIIPVDEFDREIESINELLGNNIKKKKDLQFEDYLQEKHAEQFVGTKDCMIDNFNEWLIDEVDIDDIMDWADDWFKRETNRAKKELLESLQCSLNSSHTSIAININKELQKL